MRYFKNYRKLSFRNIHTQTVINYNDPNDAERKTVIQNNLLICPQAIMSVTNCITLKEFFQPFFLYHYLQTIITSGDKDAYNCEKKKQKSRLKPGRYTSSDRHCSKYLKEHVIVLP